MQLTVIANIPGQGPFRNISAYNGAFRNSSRRIKDHIFIGHFPNRNREPVKGQVFFQISGDKVHNLQLSFGDGTGFIRKQQVQTACRFNAVQLAHQHMVVQHLPHIQGRNDSDHQGQSFRHRHHDDDDSQNQRLHHITEDLGRIGNIKRPAACQEHLVQQHRNKNQQASCIAEVTDLIRQMLQFQFQRAVPFHFL